MLFPTTLILGLLSITPALAAPIIDVDTEALIARDVLQSLATRGDIFDLDFDKRDIAGDEMFEELVARSPEPEPEPLPMPLPEGEIEDMERRGWFGAALKIGKGIAKLAHKGHKAHSAYQNHKNHRRSEFEDEVEQLERRHVSAIEIEARSAGLEPRSKIGNRIKNFFKKVGKGIVKGVKAVAKFVLRRSDDATNLEARSFDEPELEARDFEEPVEIEARSFEEPELETRSVDEPELEARDFDEMELEARDFDEQEIEAREFEEEEF